MNPVVTISGGGIIGNYISSRLSKNNIESLIIERSKSQNVINENIRTLTLNSFSKKLLDDLGINLKPARQMGMRTIKVMNEKQALEDLDRVLGAEST